MTQYTGRQRVEAAFRGEYADRVPLEMAIRYNSSCAKLAGITIKEYYLEPEKALKYFIKVEETFPSDAINVPTNPLLPEALAIRREATSGPEAKAERILAEKSAMGKMAVRDPTKSITYVSYLKVCGMVNSMFPDRWVVGLVPGTWTPSGEMRGVEQLIYDTADDPAFVHNLMRFNTEYAKVRALAVAETGVNVVFGEPSASCSLISPKIYKEFVKPYHKELFSYMRQKINGKVKIGLHICGYIDPIMEELASLPIDWIEMDSPSSLEKILRLCQKRIVVRGNVSLEALSSGTREQIEGEVKNCVRIGAKGSGYILAPGCSMPQNAPLENIRHLWELAQRYGRYPAPTES